MFHEHNSLNFSTRHGVFHGLCPSSSKLSNMMFNPLVLRIRSLRPAPWREQKRPHAVASQQDDQRAFQERETAMPCAREICETGEAAQEALHNGIDATAPTSATVREMVLGCCRERKDCRRTPMRIRPRKWCVPRPVE
jgi:hypothetical protein